MRRRVAPVMASCPTPHRPCVGGGVIDSYARCASGSYPGARVVASHASTGAGPVVGCGVCVVLAFGDDVSFQSCPHRRRVGGGGRGETALCSWVLLYAWFDGTRLRRVPEGLMADMRRTRSSVRTCPCTPDSTGPACGFSLDVHRSPRFVAFPSSTDAAGGEHVTPFAGRAVRPTRWDPHPARPMDMWTAGRTPPQACSPPSCP